MSTPLSPTAQKPLMPANLSGRRIVALWFPYWAAEVTAHDYDHAAPFALVDNHKNAQRLVGLTPLAEQAGLSRAMPLADARAVLPELQIAMADPLEATQKLTQCTYWLQRYTPWVGALGGMGDAISPQTAGALPDYSLLLDVSGCAHLFGGERALLEDMAARFDRRGITLRAAMAGTIGAAWGLARFSPMPLTILPEGQEAEAVLRLPPAALRLSPSHIDLCQRLGLDTVAQLARFPRRDLTRRFGPEPVMRLEQALGQAGESLNPCLPPPRFMVTQNLAQGVTQMHALADLISGLCDRLAAQLQAEGQGAQRLDLVLTRSDNAVLALSLPLAHPSAEGAHMARLFAARLERLSRGVDAGYGIEHLLLAASRSAAMTTSQEAINLSGRLRQTAPVAALGNLYDRLVNRLGPKIVVRPVPHASYIPERAVRFASVLETPQAMANEGAPDAMTRPLFMLCAPEPIDVIAEIPEGAPYRFRWRRVLHEVSAAYGPERISPEWWAGFMGGAASHHNQTTRDYYRVEDIQGQRFWLYRDGLYGRETDRPRWFMHGIFP